MTARAIDEVQIAYHDYRVLVIDQTDSELESHWGVGNRAGLFVAMEMCLQGSNGLISKPFPELQAVNPVPHRLLPPTPPSALLSSPTLPSQEESSEADIDRIKLSSHAATESLQLHLNQKKEESTNRLKQRLLERKQKKSQSERGLVEVEESPLHSSPSPLPPAPPLHTSPSRSKSQTLPESNDHFLPSLVKQLISFSPLLCPSLSQYQFLSFNHLATRQEQEEER
jgi:hypothetical protein